MGGLSFLSPIAGLLAAGIGSALVVLFWMLKLRRQPVRVSSTMLWKRSVQDLEGNIPWQRVRPSWLLLLQILAVLLLAAAIGRPVRDGMTQVGGEVIVILDAGASMNSILNRDGETRFEVGQEQAVDLVRSIGDRDSSVSFRVIRAGAIPNSVGSPSGSWRLTRAAINSIDPSDSASDLAAAIELAQSSSQQADSDDERDAVESSIVVITDQTLDGSYGTGVRVVSPRVSVDDDSGLGNLGIVQLGGQRDVSDPDQCRVFVSVAGRIETAVGIRLQAKSRDSILATEPLELKPDSDGVAQSQTTLSFPLKAAGLVEISFVRSDQLNLDNQAWISMPDPSPIVTTVVAPDALADPLLIDAVRSATGGPVNTIAPGESLATGAGLIVFDRASAVPSIGTPSIVVIANAEDESAGATLERAVSWKRGHPLMRDLELSGLRYARTVSTGTDTDPSDQTIVAGSDGPLIIERSADGVRQVEIGFELSESNWGVQISMPMFFANAAAYLLPGSQGSGVTHRTGHPVLDTGVVPSAVGLMEIEGEPFGISLLDERETIRAGFDQSESSNTQAPSSALSSLGSAGRVEIWRWFVIAAIGLLSLEWVIDLMRRRV